MIYGTKFRPKKAPYVCYKIATKYVEKSTEGKNTVENNIGHDREDISRAS